MLTRKFPVEHCFQALRTKLTLKVIGKGFQVFHITKPFYIKTYSLTLSNSDISYPAKALETLHNLIGLNGHAELGSGIHCLSTELLLDSQELVVLGKTL